MRTIMKAGYSLFAAGSLTAMLVVSGCNKDEAPATAPAEHPAAQNAAEHPVQAAEHPAVQKAAEHPAKAKPKDHPAH